MPKIKQDVVDYLSKNQNLWSLSHQDIVQHLKEHGLISHKTKWQDVRIWKLIERAKIKLGLVSPVVKKHFKKHWHYCETCSMGHHCYTQDCPHPRNAECALCARGITVEQEYEARTSGLETQGFIHGHIPGAE